jgi:diguanylate cyclase (GGDEF)-like protein
MDTWRQWLGIRAHQDVPTDIRISLVDALYTDRPSLFIGSTAASVSALITAGRTGATLILLCAAAMILVACARAWDMYAFARQRANLSSPQAAAYWERRYVVGAATFVGLLGAWCLAAFIQTTDPFVRLISFSLTLAYLIGVSGRNFASKPLVIAQTVCAGVPLSVALLLAGDLHYTILAFVLLPFFAALRLISDRLRKILLDSLISGRNTAALASRFDTALNNMPHGLCMFDANKGHVVSNRRTAEWLNLSKLPNGIHFTELLRRYANVGVIEVDQLADLEDAFNSSIRDQIRKQCILTSRQERVLTFTFQPMENGGLVMLLEDVTERHHAESKLKLARYDPLTNLPNRAFFRESVINIAAQAEAGDSCALLFLDLDEFKRVNDTLGHARGDELLCAVAERLRRATAEQDVVARLAGDEFVVFHPAAGDAGETASLARRIIDMIAAPYEIDGHEVIIGTSIGIAVERHGSLDFDRLLREADVALYRAKAEGGSELRCFEPEMDALARARRDIEIALRNAFSNDEFEVYYQPVINLKTQQISACEALVRWNHPSRGIVTPEEFISVAEDTGLIIELGNWVLRHACGDCARWPAGIRVAVNLSPVQLRRADVVESIRAALTEVGLPSHRLEVEITESALLPDTKAIRQRLNQIRGLGVRISLDDFGTGYSSLSYLHAFPLNKIKIDRTFLREIERDDRSLALLRGVARLAVDLGMAVTVEGVETDKQLALLAAESSIDEAQGFLFSPPMNRHDIRSLLNVTGTARADIDRVA